MEIYVNLDKLSNYFVENLKQREPVSCSDYPSLLVDLGADISNGPGIDSISDSVKDEIEDFISDLHLHVKIALSAQLSDFWSNFVQDTAISKKDFQIDEDLFEELDRDILEEIQRFVWDIAEDAYNQFLDEDENL